jgi:hypothetical protein
VELFPIRVDHRIDHLTTQQALPAGEAERRASRILQSDGHHQTMTTKTVHELAPGLDTARGVGTFYGIDILHEAMAGGQGPRPLEPRPPRYERRRSAVSKRYNECVRSTYENVLRWSGGDWRIGRARTDQGTRGMGQPAGLKRLSVILRVKGR